MMGFEEQFLDQGERLGDQGGIQTAGAATYTPGNAAFQRTLAAPDSPQVPREFPEVTFVPQPKAGGEVRFPSQPCADRTDAHETLSLKQLDKFGTEHGVAVVPNQGRLEYHLQVNGQDAVLFNSPATLERLHAADAALRKVVQQKEKQLHDTFKVDSARMRRSR